MSQSSARTVINTVDYGKSVMKLGGNRSVIQAAPTLSAFLSSGSSCFSGEGHPLAISESTALKYERLDPDVRLMLQVRNDDASAFEELMLRYQSRVISIMEHLVSERQHAEDLAQETWLAALRHRDQGGASGGGGAHLHDGSKGHRPRLEAGRGNEGSRHQPTG